MASLALSLALLLGINRVREGARESFRNTISKTDLIVGAKGGSLQLLLYSVFRIGSATNNVSYQSFEEWTRHPDVAWTIPYSLGDSHRGYRVVGTNDDFYEHYRYRYDHSIAFEHGHPPQALFDVVVGAEVAKKLSYKMGDKIVLSHGVASTSFQDHSDKPFTIVGILEKTNTPIDRSLYVSLEAIEAIHIDWSDGAPPVTGSEVKADQIDASRLKIEQITCFLLGAKSRLSALKLQRAVNTYPAEGLMAILPGVALDELWEAISYAEIALLVVSVFVIAVGLMGMLISIYQSLNERRREIAILRAVGASGRVVFGLLVWEAWLLTTGGIIGGVLLMYSALLLLQPLISQQMGLYIPIQSLGVNDLLFMLAMLVCGVLMGVVPALRAYVFSMQDGLQIRS